MILVPLFCGAALSAEFPSVDAPPKTAARSSRDAAVVIGVQDYDHLGTVPYALKDAETFLAYLESTRGINRRTLFSAENPNDDEMRSLIARGVARVRGGGTLWIYYAGQGVVTDGSARILGADLTKDELGGALSIAELEAMAARSRADQVVLIVDAPFDLGGRDDLQPGTFAVPSDLTIATGESSKVLVWVADRDGHAQILPATGHGLFTWLALGALRGWADGADGSTPDGKVTTKEAHTYVGMSGVALGRPQRPYLSASPKLQSMVLSDGVKEQGPDSATFAAWSVADRDRRLQIALDMLNAQADAALQEAVAKAKAGDPQGPELVAGVIDRYQGASVTITWVVPLDAVTQARALLADPSKLQPNAVAVATPTETGGSTTPNPTVGNPTVSTPTAATRQYSDDTCTDLVSMEPDALMGNFSAGRIACVEKRLANPKEPQTNKDKLSRLLMANAEANQDWDNWERLIKRHLEEIGRSDPDLCFRYAVYLSKKGVEYCDEVIRWAGYALENKQIWTGDTYKKRVYHLYRLRTEAAAELWRDAEQQLIADPNDQNEAISERFRGQAKEFAREWLDYAHASGQAVERPLQMCLSAAGTMSACQDR